VSGERTINNWKGRYDGNKPRAYVAKEQDENNGSHNEGVEDSFDVENRESDYHAADPNVDYYDIEAYNRDEGNEEPEVNFVTASLVECRDCCKPFPTRNALFRHLRSKTEAARCPTERKAKTNEAVKADVKPAVPEELTKILKITPTRTSTANVGTGYGFQNWHYVTAKAHLSNKATAEPICLDTECSVTLLDRAFFQGQCHNDVEIRTMATPIPVRGIGSDKHMTSKYVIVPIHLSGTSVAGKDVKAVITREAHLVDGLKAKMLVGMNIMSSEQIDIITSLKQAIIDTCQGTIIPIEIRPKGSPTRQTIHAKSNLMI